MSGRIRTVKPEWLEDELIAAASDEARVLSVALILMADDYGRGRASVATVAAGAWRYQMERDDGAHAPEILARASRAIRELVDLGFVKLYEVDRQRYFAIRNWAKHQKVDKPSKPRVPVPQFSESQEISSTPETLARHSRDCSEGPENSRETLAPDLRSPTSDQGSPTGSGTARERADAPPADPSLDAKAREQRDAHGLGMPPTGGKVRTEHVSQRDTNRVLALFAEVWTTSTGLSDPGLNPNREYQSAADVYRAAVALRPEDPLGVIREAMAAACAQESFRKAGNPWWAFAKQPWRNLPAEKRKRANPADPREAKLEALREEREQLHGSSDFLRKAEVAKLIYDLEGEIVRGGGRATA